MTVSVKLGDFKFEHFEVPEHINGGGDQACATHKLVGGIRVVDAMGRDDSEINWSGTFAGLTAESRARYLDELRVKGQPLSFTYSLFTYNVLIKSFTWNFLPNNRISYAIGLLVIADLSNPVKTISPSGFDDAITEDMDTALDIGQDINNATLSSSLAALSDAVGAVPSFSDASLSTINNLIGMTDSSLGVVNELISVTNAKLF